MTALFADTFYWVALADLADGAHQRALAITAERAALAHRRHRRGVDRVPYVFSTAPESLRREAAEGVEEILASSVIRVIPQSPESFLADLQLYRARPDKGYSLVDCLDANDAQGGTDRSSYPTTGILSRKAFRALFAIRERRFVAK